jgi:acylphosphatase
MVVARHIYISGEVQGVFFRKGAREEASELGITGWVRNLEDGRVEIFAEGEDNQMQAFVKWCKKGPKLAHVSGFNIEEVKPEGHDDFKILR